MYEEKNSGTNLPAQIDILATSGETYEFLFVAKGGGSANKSLLFQETKALLNPASLESFLDQKLRSLGTAACPPYHLAVVIGGTSAEATAPRWSSLPAPDTSTTCRPMAMSWVQAFRDQARGKSHDAGAAGGIGAQFSSKYFALDARVNPAAAAWRVLPCGDRRLVLGRSQPQAGSTAGTLGREAAGRNPARFISCRAPPPGLETNIRVAVDLE